MNALNAGCEVSSFLPVARWFAETIERAQRGATPQQPRLPAPAQFATACVGSAPAAPALQQHTRVSPTLPVTHHLLSLCPVLNLGHSNSIAKILYYLSSNVMFYFVSIQFS